MEKVKIERINIISRSDEVLYEIKFIDENGKWISGDISSLEELEKQKTFILSQYKKLER